jgi:hypothetical protein
MATLRDQATDCNNRLGMAPSHEWPGSALDWLRCEALERMVTAVAVKR